MRPPKVTGSWQQAKRKGAVPREEEHARRKSVLTAAERVAHERALPRRRVNTAQEIGFAAEYFGETIGPISVIAGEGAPTITGGWLKVAQVQRFQRTSITVPEGYAPRVLSVPILFDAVIETKERPHIEKDIATLERMAGRPKGDSLPGEAPRVEVFSTDSSDNRTNLIPRKLQEDGELLWWITDIAFDPNPLRDAGGERIRQAAVVELLEIYLAQPEQARARKEQKSLAAKRPKKFRTTDSVNTIRLVAKELAGHFHNKQLLQRWKTLLAANRRITMNADKKLKRGTVVNIPAAFWSKAPR